MPEGEPGSIYSRDGLIAVEIWKYVQHRETGFLAENGELPVFGNGNQMQTYIVIIFNIIAILTSNNLFLFGL